MKSQHIRASTPPETLSPESRGNLVCAPVNLDFSRIYILIDSDRALVNVVVFPFTLLENLEDEITTNGRIVRVTKMLVDTLLERFDAFTKFFGIVCIDKFLKNRARV
jgi:hypothetical protein